MMNQIGHHIICATELANSAIEDVRVEQTVKRDGKESFYLAETLK